MNGSDELSQVLADLATRADLDQPKDRLEGIHRRARRTARARAIGATVVAVVVLGGAAALFGHGRDTAAPVVPATPSVTTAPVPTGHATSSPAPNTPVTRALVPPDAKAPAAGGCQSQSGAVVTVDANPDVPAPRCVVIRADQRLRVVNTSDLQGSVGQVITVRWADYAPRVLQVGQATTFDRPVGDYLAAGVHYLRMPPLYAGSNAEVRMR